MYLTPSLATECSFVHQQALTLSAGGVRWVDGSYRIAELEGEPHLSVVLANSNKQFLHTMHLMKLLY